MPYNLATRLEVRYAQDRKYSNLWFAHPHREGALKYMLGQSGSVDNIESLSTISRTQRVLLTIESPYLELDTEELLVVEVVRMKMVGACRVVGHHGYMRPATNLVIL